MYPLSDFRRGISIPKSPPSVTSQTFETDLIVASIKDKTVVVKDRYHVPNENEVVDTICRMLSRYVFGNKLKMFVPIFEEDMKEAIEGVMKKHGFAGKLIG